MARGNLNTRLGSLISESVYGIEDLSWEASSGEITATYLSSRTYVRVARVGQLVFLQGNLNFQSWNKTVSNGWPYLIVPDLPSPILAYSAVSVPLATAVTADASAYNHPDDELLWIAIDGNKRIRWLDAHGTGRDFNPRLDVNYGFSGVYLTED